MFSILAACSALFCCITLALSKRACSAAFNSSIAAVGVLARREAGSAAGEASPCFVAAVFNEAVNSLSARSLFTWMFPGGSSLSELLRSATNVSMDFVFLGSERVWTKFCSWSWGRYLANLCKALKTLSLKYFTPNVSAF